jgi:hypothetical protein
MNDKKTIVEECFSLDVNVLLKNLKFYGGATNMAGNLSWTNSDDKVLFTCFYELDISSLLLRLWDTPFQGYDQMEYMINLETTNLHSGGLRYWFSCPINNCNRRVGKLYKPRLFDFFGCRTCHNLTLIDVNYFFCQRQLKFPDYHYCYKSPID